MCRSRPFTASPDVPMLDGASAWQRFRWITLPLLTPVIVVILILRTSFAFAVFEEILAITQGGPGDGKNRGRL